MIKTFCDFCNAPIEGDYQDGSFSVELQKDGEDVGCIDIEISFYTALKHIAEDVCWDCVVKAVVNSRKGSETR